MKLYPTISLIDLAGDTLAEVSCIDAGEVEAFRAEVRAELVALLGVPLPVAAAMISIDVAARGAVCLPMPECFGLSAQTRRQFAREVAALIRQRGLQPAASDAGAAA